MSIIEGKRSFNKKYLTRSLALMEFPFHVDIFTNFKQAQIYIAFVEKKTSRHFIWCVIFFTRCFWRKIIGANQMFISCLSENLMVFVSDNMILQPPYSTCGPWNSNVRMS